MNVVIDTNIVVSSVLKDRDPEAVIRFVVGHPEYAWIASGAIDFGSRCGHSNETKKAA